MKMSCEAQIDEGKFEQMEKEILDEVMQSSKSIIETFKFRMIFGTHLDPEKVAKTSSGLKEFRKKNWDSSINKNAAYKKYLDLY